MNTTITSPLAQLWNNCSLSESGTEGSSIKGDKGEPSSGTSSISLDKQGSNIDSAKRLTKSKWTRKTTAGVSADRKTITNGAVMENPSVNPKGYGYIHGSNLCATYKVLTK